MSKPLLINADMEYQDTSMVDPRLLPQSGMSQQLQNPLRLVEWLVGHSRPLPCLYVLGPPHKVTLALQMSLNYLKTSSGLRDWD